MATVQERDFLKEVGYCRLKFHLGGMLFVVLFTVHRHAKDNEQEEDLLYSEGAHAQMFRALN